MQGEFAQSEQSSRTTSDSVLVRDIKVPPVVPEFNVDGSVCSSIVVIGSISSSFTSDSFSEFADSVESMISKLINTEFV